MKFAIRFTWYGLEKYSYLFFSLFYVSSLFVQEMWSILYLTKKYLAEKSNNKFIILAVFLSITIGIDINFICIFEISFFNLYIPCYFCRDFIHQIDIYLQFDAIGEVALFYLLLFPAGVLNNIYWMAFNRRREQKYEGF